MAMQPKNPRYKKISEKGGRRYRDVITGEILDRKAYEARTAEPQAQPTQPNQPRTRARKAPGNPGFNPEPDPNPTQVDMGTGNPEPESGPVPMADVPEPPPLMRGLNQAANVGNDLAQAAARKGSDTLANIVGEGVAMCLNLIADIKAAPDKRYWVIEKEAIEKVTKPAARIVARHLPVEIEAVTPDGQDAAEIFKGVMYCVTAVWANKQVFDAEMRKREEEYAALFDQNYGAGSYARARAQAAQQTAGTGGPISGQGQGIVSNSAAQPNPAGAYANGNGNHRGDGGATAALIHQLYQKYPGNLGGPVGF